MGRRLLSWCLAASSIGGCWAEEPLIHDAFTAAQWAKLQQDFRPPAVPDPCALDLPAAQDRAYSCDGAARLGQQLFFEPRLSVNATTSCSSCHATTAANQDPAWYTDIRASNAVSQGAVALTPHNTITLLNVSVGGRQWFGWTGQAKSSSDEVVDCNSANDVVNKIALPRAMKSTSAIVAAVMLGTPQYRDAYFDVFGAAAPTTDASIQQNVELALGAYMRRLVSLDAPFDRFITGDAAAISDAAKRGFALFVGKAMCAECHRGGTFSDDDFHVTGVDDATLDKGRSGTGMFYTATLRNIEKTAPYMHKGTFATLGDVIDFYSRGGGTWGGYTGEPDPLMHPFELEPEEALDLQAFMLALTGAPVPVELRRDTHAAAPLCSDGMCTP
jgi:cytochrome c peroxidase